MSKEKKPTKSTVVMDCKLTLGDSQEDNAIFVPLLKEIAKDFCEIKNPVIMQYTVNLVKTIKEMGNDIIRVKAYCDDITGK